MAFFNNAQPNQCLAHDVYTLHANSEKIIQRRMLGQYLFDGGRIYARTRLVIFSVIGCLS